MLPLMYSECRICSVLLCSVGSIHFFRRRALSLSLKMHQKPLKTEPAWGGGALVRGPRHRRCTYSPLMQSYGGMCVCGKLYENKMLVSANASLPATKRSCYV